MGWFSPFLPPVYDFSSIFSNTVTSGFMFLKLYHSSKRSQICGRPLVAGCFLSTTINLAFCCLGCESKLAPTIFTYQGQLYSQSVAACTPTKPPPLRI